MAELFFPPGRQALFERNRYSPAVRSNGFLFVSGQVGSREDGSPEPDLEAQVRRAFENLNAVLGAAGWGATAAGPVVGRDMAGRTGAWFLVAWTG